LSALAATNAWLFAGEPLCCFREFAWLSGFRVRAAGFTACKPRGSVATMSETPPRVVNVDDVDETTRTSGERWGASFKP
jgi:hypothetical protein